MREVRGKRIRRKISGKRAGQNAHSICKTRNGLHDCDQYPITKSSYTGGKSENDFFSSYLSDHFSPQRPRSPPTSASVGVMILCVKIRDWIIFAQKATILTHILAGMPFIYYYFLSPAKRLGVTSTPSTPSAPSTRRTEGRCVILVTYRRNKMSRQK